MDVTFTPEQDALRAAVRDLLSDHAARDHVRAVFTGGTGTDPELYARLVALGVTDLPGALELGIVAEQAGRALAPVPLVSGVGVGATALRVLAAAGSPHANELLASVRSGGAVAVLAPEPASDDLVRGVVEPPAATHVLYVRDGRVRAMALAAADVRMHHTMDGLRRLGDVPVDDALAHDLGPEHPAVPTALRHGIVALAHELVGVAQACLDMAVRHARAREQFGKPIGTYQAISHRCADMFVTLESARSHAYFAAWALDAGHEAAELAASQAKASASDAAVTCAHSCIQVHGGIGFTWEHDAHLYLKRARSGAAFLGTATEHRRRIADLLGI